MAYHATVLASCSLAKIFVLLYLAQRASLLLFAPSLLRLRTFRSSPRSCILTPVVTGFFLLAYLQLLSPFLRYRLKLGIFSSMYTRYLG
nr:MAG TPA: hypothetical protein [Caudoviricetes sp.]